MKEDIVIQCCDCHEDFTFTSNDQKFYEEHDYCPPKRCKACRILKQKNREKFGQFSEKRIIN